MKRVVLTGASGFVGANLVYQLLEKGHEIHLLLRAEYKDWRIHKIKKDINIHIVDLNDTEAIKTTISLIKPDWIFHLAAYGAYSSQTNMEQMTRTNLIATINLVNTCADLGFEAFINTGSSSEYGFKDHAPSENEIIEPNSMYAITKAAATHYCSFIAKTRNLNLSTVRLYSVFGPYEAPTRLIPTLIVDGFLGKLPPLVNPSIARDYVYVDDICSAYLTIASNPSCLSGKIYNLGSGIQMSLREVVEVTRSKLSLTVKPEWGSMPDRQWDTSVWVADHSRIMKELGWNPKFSFNDGFLKTVEWFQTNPDLLTYYKNHRVIAD